MPFFADLSLYRYLPDQADSDAVNVGWLADGHPFTGGDVPPEFVRRLARLALRHAVNRTRGWARCPFCDIPYPVEVAVDGEHGPVGDAEIHVTGRDGHVYAGPTLIVHYVAAHGYRPPDAFVEAVLEDRRADADP